MKSELKSLVTSVALLGILASACGQKSSGKKNESGGNTVPGRQGESTSHSVAPDGTNIDGYYLATFTTLNPHINGTIPGSATFYRKEDRFFAFLRLFAGAPKAWHQQKVYTGSRCPTPADDANNDGFIDIVEAEAVVGKVLIPMDADLGTQMSGRNFYPVGDLSGSYHYERVVSFSRFFNDLKGEDKVPEDNIIKLAPDQGLDIVGRVVMVQGTAETIEYPETVASTNRHKPFQTLPIACGIFKKNDVGPGTPYDETIPGPVADVEEGQDRPAPDDLPTGTSGSSGTTGTNESETGESETQDENGNRSGGRRHGENTSGGTGGTGGTTTGTTGRTGGETTSGDTGHEGGSTTGESTSGEGGTTGESA